MINSELMASLGGIYTSSYPTASSCQQSYHPSELAQMNQMHQLANAFPSYCRDMRNNRVCKCAYCRTPRETLTKECNGCGAMETIG